MARSLQNVARSPTAASSESITRRSRSSFLLSFLFLPKRKRRAIVALYAMCRTLDDCADDARCREDGRRRLDDVNLSVERAYAGVPRTNLEKSLAEALRNFPVSKSLFEELARGVAMDLEGVGYETYADLELYCYRVASVVGLMCIEVFGYRNPGTREYARTLGLALQLVNIARDVREDAAMGRVYLPRNALREVGYPPEGLRKGQHDTRFEAVMQAHCQRARAAFEEARALLPAEDRRSLLPAEIMRATYEELLGRIERGGYRVLDRRIRVPRLARVRIALRELWRSRKASIAPSP